MTLRSMTGFAQVKGRHGDVAFTVSLKSVNHRFLDLHLRLPQNADALEQKLRRLLKDQLHRGHVELTLTLESTAGAAVSVNRELVAGYIEAFRRAAAEFNVPGEPDLNAIFRINGVLAANGEVPAGEELEQAIVQCAGDAIERLHEMRAGEGKGITSELRAQMDILERCTNEIAGKRADVSRAFAEKIQSRIQELTGQLVDPDRVLQEAALLAEKSDIQEEVVRMTSHIAHFRELLAGGGEVGKKLDFLVQEMNREANTMLSKTSGITGDALRITELGLALKAAIEKSREQVQNIE